MLYEPIVPLFLLLIGKFFGKSKLLTIFFTSDTRSFTFSWCAVKCAVTNRNDVPNTANEHATAPFVLKAVPGLTDKLASSGTEQYQIRSLLKNIAKCNVPERNVLIKKFIIFDEFFFCNHYLKIWNERARVLDRLFLVRIPPIRIFRGKILAYQMQVHRARVPYRLEAQNRSIPYEIIRNNVNSNVFLVFTR